MKDLLPHYERELAFLRQHAGDFAQRYPKIAGRLMLSGDVGEDPHVERLIEAFAFLSSRIHKRLDDDFPLFTESFLEVLYPHYLRPFPSCAIARLDVGGGAAQLTQGSALPRGSLLSSRPVRGVTCRFRTAFPTALLPLRVVSAAFRGAVQAPDGTPVPLGATSLLSVELALVSPQARWSTLGVEAIRLHIDGEASQVAAVREAFFGRVQGALLQTSLHGPWHAAADALPREVGFAEDEALIDFDARSHPAYRLLTEYFAFPEKFNFVDLPLPAVLRDSAARSVTLHFPLSGVRSDSDEARLLETLTERNLVLGCTPVVNLFRQRAEPIRVTHSAEAYPVLPDARRAFGFEVHSVERVWRVRQSAQGEAIDEFRPFYSLQHDDLLADGEAAGRYWYVRRNEAVADVSPGFETELAIVDVDFDPAQPQTDTLSLEVMATNRDLPSQLSIANPGGDLFQDGGGLAREIRLLRKPTPTVRFERGRGALWRLISHLSLNHLSLSGGGIDALKEMLRLYDLPRSASNRSVLEGLLGIDYRAATACLPGDPFPCFVRGIEVRLLVEEQRFAGSGLRLFAQVLDHFFGLYVHANSFTQLKLVSARTQEELVTCPRRSGGSPLL
ncbi:type VI secretion system ImpG/VasA family protein [Rubrivivax gelatinosus]|uniref:type VI secretion system baseplate subunit TssF n=1 Tax=Rubrivivax gelatinosus TaxID=28068 RepID=UPI001903583E|nr:type VI secretion system baseplate subunit TssF [Rubrivivax gelatinosus]MBK1613906.1 type VI secretion system ImpG/VasA family protein [Rubrivivax gelatinosus]